MKRLAALLATAALISPMVARTEEKPPGTLVVTSEELAPAFAAYASWKVRLGMPTEVVSITDIEREIAPQDAGSTGPAPDTQEAIRRLVRDRIDNAGVRWVVLGGDSGPDGTGHVPDRDSFHQTMWGKNAHIPTDIFYLSRGDWDADGDGVHGEFEDDREAIDYPDGSVAIGRIPARTPDDVAAYLDKVIAYETRHPIDEFACRMIYTCAVPEAEPKLHTSWLRNVAPSWPSGNAEMFFNTRSPWDREMSGDHPLSPRNLIALINRGEVGKFHLHGHGLRHCWVLEDHRELTTAMLAALDNQNAYPIITTVSCFTGQFDAAEDPSVTEAMLRLPKAGAIAIVAPSREGKPHFTDPQRDFPLMMNEGKMDGTTETMTRFWQHGLAAPTSIGEAFTAMKADLSERAASHPNFHLCLCELNLLGDPTLPMHAQAPRTIETAWPESLTSGTSRLELGDLPAGAEVVISDGEQILWRAEVPESGRLDREIELPDSDGALSIAIRKPGYNSLVRQFD